MIRRFFTLVLLGLLASPVSAQTIGRLKLVTVVGGMTSVSPIAGSRLPGGVTTAPDTYWSQYSGVDGGIPTYTQKCGPNITPSMTAAQVNTQIAGCGVNQYVFWPAGTYTYASGGGGIVINNQSGVELRGAGPDATFLIFNDTTGCLGQFSAMCIQGSGNLSYYAAGTPTHSVNWTAGYAPGTKQITLANTTGLVAGMFIVLDQIDDVTYTADVTVCATSGTCVGDQGGLNLLGRNCGVDTTCRYQHQWVKAVSCSPACGGSGSTVVTIDRPIYMPNWRSSQTPQAFWGISGSIPEFDGISEMSIDGLHQGGGQGLLNIVYAANSWVKHVRLLYAPTPTAHTRLYGSPRITWRDNYAFGTADMSSNSAHCTSQHYGVEEFGAGDELVENNIFQHRTSAFVRDNGGGSVYGYNFIIDNCYYDGDYNWMQAQQYSHAAGNGMILDEGNSGVSIKGDAIHGTSNLFTEFRNYALGWEVCFIGVNPCPDSVNGGTITAKTQETIPFNLYAGQRFWNFVGNVGGKPGYHDTYSSTTSVTAIWRIGAGTGNIPDDPVTGTTLLRWGNCDSVSGFATCQFNASEVPSGLSFLGNPVPTCCALPVSYYLKAKPPFMGSSDHWPGIGPDVTGGDVANTGGHVFMNPAERCYRTIILAHPDATYTNSDTIDQQVPGHFTCAYPLP